jgi:hypothetical protein
MSTHSHVLLSKGLLEALVEDIDTAKSSLTDAQLAELQVIVTSEARDLDRLIGDSMTAQLIKEEANYIGSTYYVTVAGQDTCEVTVTYQRYGAPSAHDLRVQAEEEAARLRNELETMTADRDAEKGMKAKAREQRDAMTDEVTRLKKDLLIPGVQRCAKCTFRRNSMVMSAQTGTISAAEAKPEPCPNGCGPLWPVTWEEDLRAEWASTDEKWEFLRQQRDFAVSLIKRLEEQRATLDEVLTDAEHGILARIVAGVGLDEIIKPDLKSIATENREEAAPTTASELMNSQRFLDCACHTSCDCCDPNNTMERKE